MKELERAIVGYDYDDDNEDPKYEESIAERTKMRRQNKETDKKDASRTFAPPDPDSDDSDESTEIYETPYSLLCDDEETEEGYNKEGYDVLGITSGGLIKMGLIKMGMTGGGLIKMGLIKMEKKIKNIINGDIT